MAGTEELVTKGYAVEVLEAELDRDDGKVSYLLLHSVINPIKGKPHIIFDCAAQHTAVSFNSKVIQGPDLTNKLVGVLTHFCPPSGTDG